MLTGRYFTYFKEIAFDSKFSPLIQGSMTSYTDQTFIEIDSENLKGVKTVYYQKLSHIFFSNFTHSH